MVRIIASLLGISLLLSSTLGLAGNTINVYDAQTQQYKDVTIVQKSDDEWKKELSPMAYDVTRHEGTERAFTGAYHDNHKKGIYRCIGCGLDLFSSVDKFNSGTGWPSFTRPIDKANIAYKTDNALFMVRTEVHCPRCGAHLGHVFDDGPAPTGKRFCINSAALKFIPSN